MKRLLLLAGVAALAGCLNATQSRVTAEHRQLNNRVGIVVLLDGAPALHQIALEATKSTRTAARLAAWDVQSTVGDFLAQRLRGKGMEVVGFRYDPAEFSVAYDNAWSYPWPDRIRERLCALGVAQQVDMLVVVYRLADEDFVADSVENLVGYGVVRHARSGDTHAYALVYVEALDVSNGGVIGESEGLKAIALPADLWREDYAVDRTPLAIGGEDGVQLAAAITDALTGAVLTAAQEAGLSN